MKLRNKKTGEIKEFSLFDGNVLQGGATLESLTDEWEDYEGQKEYLAINEFGTLVQITHSRENIYDKSRKNFGNYFETKEEAEKAVEKLKAWKRLKDKGYRVMMNNHVDGMLYLRIWNDTTDAPTPINKADEIYKDLDLLFGGEE